MSTRLTQEGDPITSIYRVLVGGTVEIFIDSTQDRWSADPADRGWQTYLGSGADRTWDHIATILERAQLEQLPPPWPFVVEGDPVIRKASETPSMSSLATYAERKAIDNAEGVLRESLDVPDPARVSGKSILVFDDVYTDGLTLREVARTSRCGRHRRLRSHADAAA